MCVAVLSLEEVGARGNKVRVDYTHGFLGLRMAACMAWHVADYYHTAGLSSTVLSAAFALCTVVGRYCLLYQRSHTWVTPSVFRM